MFREQLTRGVADSGGRLCVGLDPHPELVPKRFGRGAAGAGRFLQWAIEETRSHACAFKPNAAFFEAMGNRGLETLCDAVACAHAAERPVILDAKRGDIASTAAAYARAAADVIGADAITVVPYMGEEAVRPFLDRGLFTFVLTLPSNRSAAEIACHGEPALCVRVATMAARLATEYPDQVGLVVGATQPSWIPAVHAAGPDLPWLVPGVGAQGGDVRAFLGAAGGHEPVIVNASRSVLGSPDPRAAAAELKAQIGGGSR